MFYTVRIHIHRRQWDQLSPEFRIRLREGIQPDRPDEWDDEQPFPYCEYYCTDGNTSLVPWFVPYTQDDDNDAFTRINFIVSELTERRIFEAMTRNDIFAFMTPSDFLYIREQFADDANLLPRLPMFWKLEPSDMDSDEVDDPDEIVYRVDKIYGAWSPLHGFHHFRAICDYDELGTPPRLALVFETEMASARPLDIRRTIFAVQHFRCLHRMVTEGIDIMPQVPHTVLDFDS